MTTLMIYAGSAADNAANTRTGGLPLVPAGFSWPTCRTCGGPMQFLAQLRLADLGTPQWRDLLSIFMCGNDPGMCDEWDAAAGGNRALVFPVSDLTPAVTPAGPATGLGSVCAVRYAGMDSGYDQARRDWAEREGRPGRDVLGQIAGLPAWLQDDETPTCPDCAKPMSFLVQLEQGRDHRTAANFGGGCGYGFACRPCRTAAFLWQR
jgi:hypothetical protein